MCYMTHGSGAVARSQLVNLFSKCFFARPIRDGTPYCETDYHTQFGIRCDSCNRFISGRVLEVSALFHVWIRVCVCALDRWEQEGE